MTEDNLYLSKPCIIRIGSMPPALAAALLAAQRQITVVTKDAKNPHFGSTFADLPSVIDAVKGALNENGVVFLQPPVASENGQLAIATVLAHESGPTLEAVATMPLGKCDPQGYGSAMTYLRRYSLASILGLPAVDDDGEGAMNRTAKPSNKATAADKKAAATALKGAAKGKPDAAEKEETKPSPPAAKGTEKPVQRPATGKLPIFGNKKG